MILLIDMDGVICTEEKTFERAVAQPLPGAREALELLAAQGHTLVIYSARSWSELRMTKAWLDEHKIPYDGLHMGKPVADKVIDDRAIAFSDWAKVLETLQPSINVPYAGGPIDEGLLRSFRAASREFLLEIAARPDLQDPVLEVRPMRKDSAVGGTFQQMPETYVDTRALFTGIGKRYMSLDIDPNSGADRIADFGEANTVIEPGCVGTVILLSCMEHMDRVWETPRILLNILRPGGRAFMLTPWNLRFHGPRPDCWRISDDGYRALFADSMTIESLEFVPCPGRPLSPLGVKCVVQKPPC